MGVLPSPSLKPDDRRQYYDRQTRLPGWGSEGQASLAAARVVVVGAGGLGCPALEFLARAGIGRLTIVDDDRVEMSNIGRQSLYVPADIGQAKATVAARRLRRINPWIELLPLDTRMDAGNVAALISGQSLAIDGSDNFTTKFLLHDHCLAAGIPLVMASLYQWEAQLMVFPFHTDEPGCLRCLYPEAPADGCVGTCAEVGVAGALAGMTGSAQALAAIRILLGLPGQSPLTALVWDASDGSTRSLSWEADPDCPSCSKRPARIQMPQGQATLRPPIEEKSWPELAPAERRLIIDIREESELAPGDWQAIMAAGSRIIHHPWSLWSGQPPLMEAGQCYLVACAHGMRSRTAVGQYGPGSPARLISLRGGYEALRSAGTEPVPAVKAVLR